VTFVYVQRRLSAEEAIDESEMLFVPPRFFDSNDDGYPLRLCHINTIPRVRRPVSIQDP